MDRRELLRASAMLLGSAISPACAQAILSGESLDSSPEDAILGDSDMAKVATISDLIIPETDTPGAIEAGVPDFIHLIVADWYQPEERTIFLNGLKEVDVLSRERTAMNFIDADKTDQTEVLKVLEAKLSLDDPGSLGIEGGSPFFAKIKELTVIGYYTSEVGSTTELIYMPTPGRYDGDARFDELGRQWTL